MFIAAPVTRRQVVIRPNLMNVFFVLDNSISMSGSKWDTAKEGVMACIGELSGIDFVSLMVFGHELKMVDADQKKDLNAYGLFSNVRANGSCTKLYDAIIHGGTAAVQMHLKLMQLAQANNMGCHTHIIVLTDGDDTGSDKNKSDVTDFLQMINKIRGVKITMAGVELTSSARCIMQDFGRVGDDDIQFKNLTGPRDVKDMFERFAVGIREQRSLMIGAIG